MHSKPVSPQLRTRCVPLNAISVSVFVPCSIFSILSAILHLGNVTYTLSEDSQDLEVGPADVLSTLCDLLKVSSLMVDYVCKAVIHYIMLNYHLDLLYNWNLQLRWCASCTLVLTGPKIALCCFTANLFQPVLFVQFSSRYSINRGLILPQHFVFISRWKRTISWKLWPKSE